MRPFRDLSSPRPSIISNPSSSSILSNNNKQLRTSSISSTRSCETKQLLIVDVDSVSYTTKTFCRSRIGYLITSISLSAIYLLITYLLIGLSVEHLVLALIFTLFYNGTSTTRKFIIGFSIFIVYWIIFDYMKAFPNYKLRPVAIQSLYSIEKSLFGLSYKGNRYTHNEFWKLQATPTLTIIAGLFYLTWIPLPLSFAGYLFFSKKRKAFIHFSLNFLFINLIGFAIYYIYPAAPPWYIEEHGFWFDPNIEPSPGRLTDFDSIVGWPIFGLIYSKSSNIFATMPSLHVSYPSLVTFYGLKLGLPLPSIITFTIITIGISFSAVYTSHHYILDVLAGISTASIGFIIFTFFLLQSLIFTKFTNILIKETR
ncbi:phosphoinositol dihydroceramide synthase-like [Panonychus citri]|uniref:phosphoinositol dihydroceramide synthase-like n=1 Tax=Panonychus citri TaxID=50023 RepID=UPI002307F812|nr:phosphoinositol dihydroceramide synthase-like [Panonychus citri]